MNLLLMNLLLMNIYTLLAETWLKAHTEIVLYLSQHVPGIPELVIVCPSLVLSLCGVAFLSHSSFRQHCFDS